MWSKEEIQAALQELLSPKRYRHSLGVAQAAAELAVRYGADRKRAELAGLVHDCVKEQSLATMQALVQADGIRADGMLYRSRALLHGPAGAAYARREFGIEDEAVLAAISSHTVGRVGMTKLEKIVFLADYIEPNRDFPGVEELRALAKEDLDRAVLAGFRSTLRHLLEEDAPIYEPTVTARNALLEEMKE